MAGLSLPLLTGDSTQVISTKTRGPGHSLKSEPSLLLHKGTRGDAWDWGICHPCLPSQPHLLLRFLLRALSFVELLTHSPRSRVRTRDKALTTPSPPGATGNLGCGASRLLRREADLSCVCRFRAFTPPPAQGTHCQNHSCTASWGMRQNLCAQALATLQCVPASPYGSQDTPWAEWPGASLPHIPWA